MEARLPVTLFLYKPLCFSNFYEDLKAIFQISNSQLDSEAVRTKTIETRYNECEKYHPLPSVLVL